MPTLGRDEIFCTYCARERLADVATSHKDWNDGVKPNKLVSLKTSLNCRPSL